MFIRIQCNCTMDELTDTINFRNIKNKLKKLSSNTGTGSIQHLYTWQHEGTEILCYGWMDGLPGQENKHDLPPSGKKIIITSDNSDTQLLFGDLFILQKNGNKLCNLNISEYGLFYSLCFDGFDSISSDEEEEDDKDEDGSIDEDYCVSNELDEDTYEYE